MFFPDTACLAQGADLRRRPSSDPFLSPRIYRFPARTSHRQFRSEIPASTHFNAYAGSACPSEPSSDVIAPRHSRRMTHLSSDRVTHTKNRPCPWSRSEQAISSTPRACKVFGSAGTSRQLPVCTGPAREQYTTQLSVVVGHFWRAKYGHFSRVPKHCPNSNNITPSTPITCLQ